MQQMSFADESVAMVVCSHALSLVADDVGALRECARILKPEGVAVFTLSGDFRRECNWYFPAAADTGVFRRYGKDVLSRMQAAFRRVDAIDMGRTYRGQGRVRPGDYAFLCVR
jgi:ubiquinone/menaquinone biosynthesis C-methylase UbiE